MISAIPEAFYLKLLTGENMKLIQEKIEQAVSILNELDIDMWLTLCRESDSTPDPASNLFVHPMTYRKGR